MTETGGAPNGCLSDETIAALVDGRLDPETRAQAERHVAQCEACYRTLVEVGRMLRDLQTNPAVVVPFDPRPPRTLTRRYLVGALAVAALLALIVGIPRFLGQDNGGRPELAELVAAARSTRPAEARLTGGFAWAPFDSAVRGAASVGPERNVQRAAFEIEDALIRDRSASTLAAAGTSRLIAGETAGAVEALEEATAIDRNRADYWSDLAAARLARADQSSNDADLPRALDAAETAIAIDRQLSEAWFNKALVLERLGLIQQAREAWTTYLSIDSSSPWRDEAKRRLEKLPQASPNPAGRNRDAEPLRRRLNGQLLWEWSSAVAAGRPSGEALAKLQATVADIERIVPDAMARDLLRAIERAEGEPPEARRALALGYAEFVRGQRALEQSDSAAAVAAFRASRPVLTRSDSPLAVNIRYNDAVIAYLGKGNVEARRLLEAVRPEAEQRRYSTLLARTDSMLGLLDALQGRRRDADARYESALRAFDEAADPDGHAATLGMLASNYDNIGDPQRGWTYRVAALRGSSRPGVLLAASLSASRYGWLRAALILADAGFGVARDAGNPANMADALRTQAAIRSELGEADAVRNLLNEAKALVATKQEPAWDRVRAEIALAEAQAASLDRAGAGIAAATTAIDYFTQTSSQGRLPGLLTVRASLYRRTGDVQRAALDVRAGLDALEHQRPRLKTAADQVTFEAVERRLLAQFVALAASEAAADDAFGTVDRSRGRDVGSTIPSLTIEALRQSLPPRVGFAEFVVSDDSSYVWIVTRDRKAFKRIAAGRQELAELVRAATPPRDDASAVQKLSALLMAPLEEHVPPSSRLVIVPDGPLHALPFGLLRQTSGRRVVSDYSLVVTPSAGRWLTATASLARLKGPPGAVVTVGAPSLNRDEYGDLPRLPYAAEEAVQVVASYPAARRTVLRGADATRDGVVRELGHADVVHFAGHAVANPLAPEASFLALAGPAPSRLTATEIRQLRLGQSRLVVLAACDTAAGSRAIIESPLSLSRAFLAAGAAAVIGNLWPAGDRASRELFSVFHREFAATGDAAESLRLAQVALATSADTSLTPPRQWAGFILMGASAGSTNKRGEL